MSPAHVLEPTYEALRQRLLAGTWRPGARLEANRLADDLGVSMTPVRDSLNRLVGERLVEASAGEGFWVPRLDETELRALLNWHEMLISAAVRAGRSIAPIVQSPDQQASLVSRTARLFEEIASVGNGPEIEWAVSNTGARLSAYRMQEEAVLADVERELDTLSTAFWSNSRRELMTLIRKYHRRRRVIAGDLAHRARGVGHKS